MKHTKKLVSIPESEYQALLGLLDPMKKEKVLTDQKIAETFHRPGLSALDRGVRYQALARKRRMVNKKIEDKPSSMRELLEQSRAAVLPPTAGVAPAAAPQQQIQEVQQQQQPQEPEIIVEPQEQGPEIIEEKPRRTRADTVAKYHNLFEQNKLQRLKARVDAFKQYFGINERGEILSNKDKSATRIKNSDYQEILEYLTGSIELPEDQIRSIATLVPRLLKNDGINQLISAEKKREMMGGARKKGRRFVVDLKPIKTAARTRGLTRFKPLLWTKLPV